MDLEQIQSELFDPSQKAVQMRLILNSAFQDRVVLVRPGVKAWKRRAHGVAEMTPNPDLVNWLRSLAVAPGHLTVL